MIKISPMFISKFSSVFTNFGIPLHKRRISGQDARYGSIIITSSPGFMTKSNYVVKLGLDLIIKLD